MNLFQQLDTDWGRLIARGDARDATARWRRTCPSLAHVHCPAELLQEPRTAFPDASDKLLSAVVAMATHDKIAARTVLQALVPGLCATAKSLAALDDAEEIDSAVISAAWTRIRTYPHDRRPRRVAANVLLDVRKEVIRTHARPHACNALLTEPEAIMPEPPSDVGELAALLGKGLANGLLTNGDIQIIHATRIEHRTLVQESVSLRLSADTLRKRRSRAEQRLRLIARGD